MSLSELDEDNEEDDEVPEEVGSRGHRPTQDDVPDDLSAERFFQTLIGEALDRMPMAIYPEVRHRQRDA